MIELVILQFREAHYQLWNDFTVYLNVIFKHEDCLFGISLRAEQKKQLCVKM